MVNTDYVYILNPDTTLEKNTLENLFLESKKILNDFSIISPKSFIQIVIFLIGKILLKKILINPNLFKLNLKKKLMVIRC